MTSAHTALAIGIGLARRSCKTGVKPDGDAVGSRMYRGGEWQAPEAAPRQPADSKLPGYAISVAEPLAVDNSDIILFVFEIRSINI